MQNKMDIHTDSSLNDRKKELKKKAYDFENLVFSGGGAKMVAYTGAVKVLEDVGIAKRIKRYAGTSGGSIAAVLLATGHSADEMGEVMKLDMEKLIYDSWCGCISAFVNTLRRLGWHKAGLFYEKIREIMEKKTGKPDITFKEVYKRYGKELCIVATNVSTSSPEYFHLKTTPDVSVAEAVRCSCSIPGLMQPFHVQFKSGLKQMYVDGALLANYPLYVYDGWFLSAKSEDGFLNKMGEDPFPFLTAEEINTKTLGIVLYTVWENEPFEGALMERRQKGEDEKWLLKGPIRPDTKLAKKRGKKTKILLEKYGYKTRIVDWAKKFLKILQMDKEKCSYEDLEAAYEKLSKDDQKALFNGDATFAKLKEKCEENKEGLTFSDFDDFLQTEGINWLQLIDGGTPFYPKTLANFCGTLINASITMSRRVYTKKWDLNRTIGIYTDYIKTTDFKLENGDVDFLVKEGERGTIGYLEFLLEDNAEKRQKTDEKWTLKTDIQNIEVPELVTMAEAIQWIIDIYERRSRCKELVRTRSMPEFQRIISLLPPKPDAV